MNSSPTFHLRLFGAPSIERESADASRLTGRVAQRHRVALLALVAMAPGRQPDSAVAWLERSSWQWPHRAVRLDPALDPLRADPRFAQLAARVDRDMGMR